MKTKHLLWGSVLCLQLAGCSLVQDFDSLENGDASMSDASADALRDAVGDGSPDGASDAGIDGFTADASMDVGLDATADATPVDAAPTDAGMDAAYTVCRDDDEDTYGDPTDCMTVTMDVDGFVRNGDDCDDAEDAINPDTVWYEDLDGDDFGSMTSVTQCEAPSASHVRDGGDCDDGDSRVNPGANERCSTAFDDNCNGETNEASAADATTWYRDVDGDGDGDMAMMVTQCDEPAGYVSNADDCNDSDAAISTDATEVCNGIDDNCSGVVDDGMTVVTAVDSLAVALGSASDGDVFCVSGTHTGSFVVNDEITLVGRDGPGSTEMVGVGTARVLNLRANATVRGFTIRGGSANLGAGVQVESGATAELEDVVIRDNRAVNIGLGQGVGLYVPVGATANLRNVDIRNNLVRGNGRHRGIGAYITGRCEMNNVSVRGNRAEVTVGTEIYGVGITVEGMSGYLRADNLIILGNHGEYLHDGIGQNWGIGLNVQDGADAEIANAVIAGNHQVGGNVNIGVGVCVSWADATFTNVINAFNTSTLAARGNGYRKNGGGTMLVTYGAVFGNTSPTDGSSSDYHNVGATSSLSVDPMFVDTSGAASSWDVSLAGGSACIDAGNPALVDGDGSRSDMGAYGGLGGDDW